MSAPLTVARAAWVGAGEPVIAPGTTTGPCSRCGLPGRLVPAARVVSKSYTGLDSWVDARGAGLCPACTWLLGTARLRREAHLVHLDGRLQTLTMPRARAVLARPVDGQRAVVLPVGLGRKHVMAVAGWGQVTTEDGSLSWTAGDAHRLHLVAELRGLGVAGGAFTSPAPPWPVLAGASARERALWLRWWGELEPWRRARPWLRVAVAVTSPQRDLEED